MLRFGDGTPFPLDEGFLEVLVDAVSACTAMLTATARMEDRHERAREKQQALREEAHKLERFEQTVRMAAITSVPANPQTEPHGADDPPDLRAIPIQDSTSMALSWTPRRAATLTA